MPLWFRFVPVALLTAFAAVPTRAQVVIQERVEVEPGRPTGVPLLHAEPRPTGEPVRLIGGAPGTTQGLTSDPPRPLYCGFPQDGGYGGIEEEAHPLSVWVALSEPGDYGPSSQTTHPGPLTFELFWGGPPGGPAEDLHDIASQHLKVTLRSDSEVGGHFVIPAATWCPRPRA